MSPFFRVAALAARGAGRIELSLSSTAGALREIVHGALAASLHPDERGELGVLLYESRLGTTRRQLAEWEDRWLGADLPPPPSRVLIGGAGEGREAVALAARGYRICAFDPGPRAVARCRAALRGHGSSSVACARYEDLSAAVLDARGSADLAALLAAPYDAVLLGWTSVMHVLDDRERARLIEACDRVCPSGPILLTFYPASRARPRGRAFAVGYRIGSAMASLRQPAPSGELASLAPGSAFGLGCGFLRGWTLEEAAALAERVGRRAQLRGDDEGCLRLTLTPDR